MAYWTRFRSTILFLLKFLVLYMMSNLAYGWFITYHYPEADPVTHLVTEQCSSILTGTGIPSTAVDRPGRPTTTLSYNGREVLAVFEGCNGLNVMFVFVSFVFSFTKLQRSMGWFIPLGLALIYVLNMGRLIGLFFVAVYMPDVLYIAHKYAFTGMIYASVLLLWLWWVRLNSYHSP